MSIKEIKEKILSDAKLDTEKIILQAESKANDILEKGKKEAETIRKSIMTLHMQDGSLKKNKILTDANLNARKTILNEKQIIIESVFDSSLEKIINMDDKEYCKYIKNLLMSNIENGNEIVSVSQRDKNRIDKKFIEQLNVELKKNGKAGNIKLDNDFANIKGGVIISSGDIKKNISLEFLIIKAKEKYEMKISQHLFG